MLQQREFFHQALNKKGGMMTADFHYVILHYAVLYNGCVVPSRAIVGKGANISDMTSIFNLLDEN